MLTICKKTFMWYLAASTILTNMNNAVKSYTTACGQWLLMLIETEVPELTLKDYCFSCSVDTCVNFNKSR